MGWAYYLLTVCYSSNLEQSFKTMTITGPGAPATVRASIGPEV
jgi:hypothetical protein